MTGIKLLTCALILGVVSPIADSIPAATAHPQDQGQDQDKQSMALDLRGGVSLESLLEKFAELTGYNVIYDQRLFHNKKVAGFGLMEFEAEHAEDVFRTIFFANEVTLVSIGDPVDKIYEAVDVKTAQSLKQRSRYIPVNALDTMKFRQGEIIATVVPLEHCKCKDLMRSLSLLVQEHRMSVVSAIEDANALMIVNEASSVKTMLQIVRDLEKAAALEAKRAPRGHKSANRQAGRAPKAPPAEKNSKVRRR